MASSKKYFHPANDLSFYRSISVTSIVFLLTFSLSFSLFNSTQTSTSFSYIILSLILFLLLIASLFRGFLSSILNKKHLSYFPSQKLRKQKRLFLYSLRKSKQISARLKNIFLGKEIPSANNHIKKPKEVLSDSIQINLRASDLYLAYLLSEKSKKEVTLVFRFMGFKRRIQTSIWHVDANNIMIKGGMVVSIASVYRVEF